MGTHREKFLLKIRRDEVTHCWDWAAATCLNGGRFKGDKMTSPKRFAFEDWNGITLAREDVIIQTCNNKLCVNPDHLKVGTQSEAAKISWKNRQLNDVAKNVETAIRQYLPSASNEQLHLALICLGLRRLEPIGQISATKNEISTAG